MAKLVKHSLGVALWSGGAIVGGLHFVRQESDRRIWYEVTQGNTLYCLFQHKDARVRAWFILASEIEGSRARPMNMATHENGEVVKADPLYTREELPLREWLRRLAQYCLDGGDPWAPEPFYRNAAELTSGDRIQFFHGETLDAKPGEPNRLLTDLVKSVQSVDGGMVQLVTISDRVLVVAPSRNFWIVPEEQILANLGEHQMSQSNESRAVGSEWVEEYEDWQLHVSFGYYSKQYRLNVSPVCEWNGTNPVISPLDGETETLLTVARRSKTQDALASRLVAGALPALLAKVAAKGYGTKKKPGN